MVMPSTTAPGRAAPSARQDEYQRHKERAQRRNLAITLAGQDIGSIPPVKDLGRRQRADGDFRFFCETYFPQVFNLAWSADHLRVIDKIEQVVMFNEMLAVAMPRGSGKTSLCMAAVLWAVLTGRHRFVYLIAAADEAAVRLLENLKALLSSNDALLGDYPEAVYPIRRLEGESRRCSGQRYFGVPTHIEWSKDEIVMPTIPGSPSSGSVIRVSGLTGHIRGPLYVLPSGDTLRPSLAICDDPQTDASARSPLMTRERLSLINGTISGYAGPGQRTAIIIPCTVIGEGDLADQLLNREVSPQWQGERTKLLYAFPSNEKLWADYAEIRARELREGRGMRAATEFYRANQAEMDEGAQPAWRERFNSDEVSAVQNAMNLLLKNEAAFWSEYQNEPHRSDDSAVGLLTADDIAGKVNGVTRGIVPLNCEHLTMFIDVQKELLYYTVCAWEPDFTGYVIDYGAYPEQGRAYFQLRDAASTISGRFPNMGLESQLAHALEALTATTLAREWKREDGAVMRIKLCLIDANWSESTDVVYEFCRRSAHAATLMPSHGQFVGAANRSWQEGAAARKRGERWGFHWRIPAMKSKRMVRCVLIDTNFWKSFLHTRLIVARGERGSLTLFGRSPAPHRLFGEHLTAEYRQPVTGRGRTVDEWRARVGRPDNHWLDCMVGCGVGAAMAGAVLIQNPLAAVGVRRGPGGTGRRQGKTKITYMEN